VREACKACWDEALPCKGGGNKLCRKRDPTPARVAFILDSYGSSRTVVGPRSAIKANTRHDELAHIVPGLVVHNPIAWGDIPIVIERARIEFQMWLDGRPNLTEEEYDAVFLWQLRAQELAQHSLDLSAIVET
jgi:hypothetical protein